ncbi:Cysteine sulfinate desulfinase/cysteine desulfurase [Melia azedarach]|uniref:Cysteine sulfinate desulfinase/cysteine desulfurase n=1 Tax=Melia azedarach TaxID=155640 RepID=A0ACC1YDR8_MELAZ|nr:Cysteine sulfinate desulfinase/cysteine desulfurase [Melia azedarach]
MRRDQDMDGWKCEEEDNVVGMFGSDEDTGTQIPTQAQSIVEGSGAVMVSEYKPVPDVDYLQKNHIYTSGASGTNAAVIRGALRAEKPELLTVILPQSLKKQPPESQELLAKVKTVIEKPHNDHLPLIEASRLCNMDIISHVQQVICFAFHDSKLLMETCQEAKNLRKIVTLFYLD